MEVPPGGSAIAPASRRDTQSSPQTEEIFLALTDSDWKQAFNELIGFLCITLAVLIALALLSYSPKDASFNVSAAPSTAARREIGLDRQGRTARTCCFRFSGLRRFCYRRRSWFWMAGGSGAGR